MWDWNMPIVMTNEMKHTETLPGILSTCKDFMKGHVLKAFVKMLGWVVMVKTRISSVLEMSFMLDKVAFILSKLKPGAHDMILFI